MNRFGITRNHQILDVSDSILQIFFRSFELFNNLRDIMNVIKIEFFRVVLACFKIPNNIDLLLCTISALVIVLFGISKNRYRNLLVD